MRVWLVRALTSALRVRLLASFFSLLLIQSYIHLLPIPWQLRRRTQRALPDCARRPRPLLLDDWARLPIRRCHPPIFVIPFLVGRLLSRPAVRVRACRSPVALAYFRTRSSRKELGFTRHLPPPSLARLRVPLRRTTIAALRLRSSRPARRNPCLRLRCPVPPSSRSLAWRF